LGRKQQNTTLENDKAWEGNGPDQIREEKAMTEGRIRQRMLLGVVVFV
jgi:hypothetical protein